jgi:hypothetical protein
MQFGADFAPILRQKRWAAKPAISGKPSLLDRHNLHRCGKFGAFSRYTSPNMAGFVLQISV